MIDYRSMNLTSRPPYSINTPDVKVHLQAFRSRDPVPFLCPQCNTLFHRPKNVVQRRFGQKDNAQKLFCSKQCQNNSQHKKFEVNCSHCGNTIFRTPADYKDTKSGRFFCNRACAASFNMKLRKKSRRSKCEVLLFKLLRKQFPFLRMIPNDKTMLDGYEVDIAIPEIKLGIEWNGIVHFKPIYGQERLNKIQKRDADKQRKAVELGVQLMVMPDLNSRSRYVEKAAVEITKIIKQLV